jgi:hypothetical protein
VRAPVLAALVCSCVWGGSVSICVDGYGVECRGGLLEGSHADCHVPPSFKPREHLPPPPFPHQEASVARLRGAALLDLLHTRALNLLGDEHSHKLVLRLLRCAPACAHTCACTRAHTCAPACAVRAAGACVHGVVFMHGAICTSVHVQSCLCPLLCASGALDV